MICAPLSVAAAPTVRLPLLTILPVAEIVAVPCTFMVPALLAEASPVTESSVVEKLAPSRLIRSCPPPATPLASVTLASLMKSPIMVGICTMS